MHRLLFEMMNTHTRISKIEIMKKTNTQIALLLISFYASSQDQLTNSGNLKMHPGASMIFWGSLNNNGSFTDAGQTMTFNGSSAQSITGTSTLTLSNVTINNSAGVTMQQDVIIANTLTLTSGPLNLNSKTLTINNNSSTAISRTSGYIVSEQTNNSGKVKWNIASVVGSHVYPFGTASGTYIPFTLNLTAGNIGNVTISTYPTPANNTPYPTTPVSVTNLNNAAGNDNSANVVDRFWQIDKDGAGGTATITFVASSSEIGSITNLIAQRWNSSTNNWEIPLSPQTNTATSVTVSGVTNFSPWTLSGNYSPLPIELISFDAKPNGNIVDLMWCTATEINNDYFSVERSIDGITFESIVEKKGAGNSSQKINYAAIDDKPFGGITYYRLKQTDFDGKYSYSKSVPVEFNNGKTAFNIYPNPVKAGESPRINFNFQEEKEVLVILYTTTGELVYSKVIIVSKGNGPILAIDRSDILAPGIYFISATSNNDIYSEKLVIY